MSSDERLDEAAEIIARARAERLGVGVSPSELAQLCLDDAVLALYADGRARRETAQVFRDDIQRRIPHWDSIVPDRHP